MPQERLISMGGNGPSIMGEVLGKRDIFVREGHHEEILYLPLSENHGEVIVMQHLARHHIGWTGEELVVKRVTTEDGVRLKRLPQNICP